MAKRGTVFQLRRGATTLFRGSENSDLGIELVR
jgi:hypothetical protein